jgi:hypothetical protein
MGVCTVITCFKGSPKAVYKALFKINKVTFQLVEANSFRALSNQLLEALASAPAARGNMGSESNAKAVLAEKARKKSDAKKRNQQVRHCRIGRATARIFLFLV